jgi:hypothetical protein
MEHISYSENFTIMMDVVVIIYVTEPSEEITTEGVSW